MCQHFYEQDHLIKLKHSLRGNAVIGVDYDPGGLNAEEFSEHQIIAIRLVTTPGGPVENRTMAPLLDAELKGSLVILEHGVIFVAHNLSNRSLNR